jgi:uncharacterized protein (DUF58 family)
MSAPETPAPSLASELPALAALDRFLSLPLALALLAAATFLIAWNRGIALMYALFAVLVGVAALSAVGPRWMLRRATVRFALPREASVGEVASIRVSVHASGWPRRRHLVQLFSPLPFAPGKHLFLSASGGATYAHDVRCERRGVFEISELRARCAYPIGLMTVERRWPVERACITVFPRVHPVERFAAAAGSARLSGEVERPAPSIGQELFREVREYRSGDNPRHIHWRSSAHHGRLIVKQFEAIATSETWIVLDLHPGSHAGEGQDHSFERAVEIAATIASHLLRSGLRCGLAGGLREDGTFALWVPPGAGASQLATVMFALARVEAQCPSDYFATLAAMAMHHRSGQLWVLFDHGSQPLATPSFLRGDVPLRFHFQTRTFEEPVAAGAAREPPAKIPGGYSITRDSDVAALFR